MKFQVGAMSLGDILDRGLKLIAGRLGTFYAVNLIPVAPLLLLSIIQPMLPPGPAILVFVLMLVVSIIFASLVQAATVRVIEMEHVGYQITVGQALQFGLSKIGPMFLVTLIQSLLFGVGFACCIVPGFLLLTWYVFAGQVVVVENAGSIAAFERSKELTAGYRGRILGFILLIIVIYLIFFLVIMGGLGYLLPGGGKFVMTDEGPTYVITSHVEHAISTLVTQVLIIPVAAFMAACITLLYFDLRVRKEGFDLELAVTQQTGPVEST